MADLLLELFSEEIPARMQEDALEHLQGILAAKFKEIGINVSSDGVTGFVTPRRLAVWIKNLPVEQAASEIELKGPKVGAPEAALQGFLKKNNLTQNDLSEREGVYFAVIKKESKKTAEALKNIIEGILLSFPWPKSMRWGSGEATWVRPLHSMLCIFDGKVIPVTFAGVTAGNTTRGHRFLQPDVITITHPAEYEPALEKAFVIADREKRKNAILEQAQKAAAAAGLTLKKDEGLLEEVTGLVEYPVVLAGSIDSKYMDLPKEVLVSEMRAHQKYFALEKADGSLSDTFLITSNMKSNDGGKAIIAGNERVLRARLSDGRFFWDQDRKKPLSEWAQRLKTVTFHAKLGTIADKVGRIEALALSIYPRLEQGSGASVSEIPARATLGGEWVARAARLCKADLVTGMVGEFPELQGVMGRYYALEQKEDASVADAIRDHYKPQGPGDSVPSNPVAICVALADKLDTLTSMFAIGEKPTGSKDPFALRRAALGIIRIILDNGIRINLLPIIGIAMRNALSTKVHHTLISKMDTLKEAEKDFIPDEQHHKTFGVGEISPISYQEVFNFFIDRLKVQLKDSGIRHDVINAVVANGDDDLMRIIERAKALQAFIATADGANLLAAYKRAANILAIEEKKDKASYGQAVTMLKEDAEKELLLTLNDIDRVITSLAEEEKFTDAMTLLSKLRNPVDLFFDKTMVNCDDKELRVNRLRLLSLMVKCMDSIANFALIEGDTKEQKKAA